MKFWYSIFSNSMVINIGTILKYSTKLNQANILQIDFFNRFKVCAIDLYNLS